MHHGVSTIEHYDNLTVHAAGCPLQGDLHVPPAAQGLVVFVHGSGSSRHSPRNRYAAEVLEEGGLATLLMDLLTPDEAVIDAITAELRFDVPLLTRRVVGATDWLMDNPDTRNLRIGYFGASTGVAAALIAAAERPDAVHAVVSRGGRPDLAGSWLELVRAPTLLIVGSRDHMVLELNHTALDQLNVPKRLDVIQGATHLFEEPGALPEAARLARDWFTEYLTPLLAP